MFYLNHTPPPYIYTLSLHDALPIWIKFMKDGVNATPLPTVNTTGYIDHAAFLGTINPDTNKIGMVNITSRDRKSGSAGMPRPTSYAVFCLKTKSSGWRRCRVRPSRSRLRPRVGPL